MKKVLVTGGSRGIGEAIVEKFSSNGYEVYAPNRDELNLSVIPQLTNTNFDVIVNNAGVNILNDMATTGFDLQRTMDVNFYAPTQIIKQCLNHMMLNQYGRIVNMGSVWIDFAKQNRFAYSASKNALHALTKSIAVEYGKHNILCNTVSPGFINTDMTYKNNTDEQLEELIGKIPVGRLGQPSEVADMVFFLCDNNDFINGQNFIIDGGYSCSAH